MPYELFWRGPLVAFEHYREKAHLEAMRIDCQAWSQGLYILEAIQQALSSGNKRIYPEIPYLIKQEQEKRQVEQGRIEKLYKTLKNWSAGVKARLNSTPSE